MMTKEQLADLLIKRLNEIIKYDKQALGNLINIRTKCNNAMANHPSVQVVAYGEDQPTVGMLGIINGIVGTIDTGSKRGCGLITAIFQDGTLTHFRRTDNKEEP
jgi:hypothetical protein